MIGILFAITVQAPFANKQGCEKLTKNNTFSNITEQVIASSVWESNKYAFIAIIFAIMFIVCSTFLIMFVKERHGRIFFNIIQMYYLVD
jgi:hypothetical protein